MAAASSFLRSKIARWGNPTTPAALSSSSSSSSSSIASGSAVVVATCTTNEVEDKATAAENDDNSPTMPTMLPATTPSTIQEITLPGMDAVALNAIVEYAYRGTVTCDARRITDALPVLASLQMMGMQRAEAAVSTWVADHLEVSGVLRVCHMADRYQMAELGEQAMSFVDRNFAAVVEHEDWGGLTADKTEALLCRDELRPSGEINVFRALVRWAGACENVETRRASFEELLGRCVRVPLLEMDELVGEVMREPLVATGNAAALAPIHRVVSERLASSGLRAQFVSPAALRRRRADQNRRNGHKAVRHGGRQQ